MQSQANILLGKIN